MVANPHDLVEGTGQGASAGAEAAPPVARLLAGKRYPLPTECCVDRCIQPAGAAGTANPGLEPVTLRKDRRHAPASRDRLLRLSVGACCALTACASIDCPASAHIDDGRATAGG